MVKSKTKSKPRSKDKKMSTLMQLARNELSNRKRNICVFPRVGIPDALFSKLRYVDTIKLNTTSVYDYDIFSINNLYDLQYSAAGGGNNAQPLGYDQLGTLFDVYQVNAIKYDIVWYNASSQPVNAGISFRTASAIPISFNIEKASESKDGRMALLNNQQSVRQKGFIDVAKHVGLKNSELRGAGYAGIVGSNPGTQLFMFPQVSTFDNSSSTTFDVYCKIKLTLYCRWSREDTPADA